VLSIEGRATSSRSGRVARAARLVDVVAFTKAEAKELFDLLPHLDIVVVMVAWGGIGRRELERAGVLSVLLFVYVERT